MSKLTPFLIEFVGLPGVGKSTIARRVLAKLEEGEVPAWSPIAEINNKKSPIIRSLAKLPYVFYGWLRNPALVFDYAMQVRNGRMNKILLFNWLYVHGVVEWYLARPGITVCDQGLIQAVWSFHLSESDHIADFYRRILLENYPNHVSLIVQIEASPQIIRSRLGSRAVNDSRVEAEKTATYTVLDAIRAYESVTDAVRELADSRDAVSVLTLKNNDRSDLKYNVNKIVSYFEGVE